MLAREVQGRIVVHESTDDGVRAGQYAFGTAKARDAGRKNLPLPSVALFQHNHMSCSSPWLISSERRSHLRACARNLLLLSFAPKSAPHALTDVLPLPTFPFFSSVCSSSSTCISPWRSW